MYVLKELIVSIIVLGGAGVNVAKLIKRRKKDYLGNPGIWPPFGCYFCTKCGRHLSERLRT